MKNGPIWQCPQRPMPQSMWRSSDTKIRRPRDPAVAQGATVGLHHALGPAQERQGPAAESRAGRGAGDHADLPEPVRAGAVDDLRHLDPAAAQASSSGRNNRSAGVRAP